MPEVIQAENLQNLPGMRHGFFASGWGHCGLSTKFGAEEPVNNRARVAQNLGIDPACLLSCHQIHSPDVVTVTSAWTIEGRPSADAMVTKTKKLALGILTADCVPLLFADNHAGVVGGAHAGWRGALSGIIENTVIAMEDLGASRRGIHAAIGPCIWQKSYEVGPEFPAPFLAEDPEARRFFRPGFRSGHYMFNLPGYVEAKLRKLGVASIEQSPGDTCAEEERFFSYRRSCLKDELPTRNLISVIVLND